MNTNESAVIIDTKAIERNYLYLRSFVNKKCQIAPVVKADSYSLGAIEVVRCLNKFTDFFYVATLEEAMQLRANFKKIKIALLSGPYESCEAEIIKAANIIPVLNCPKQVELAKDIQFKEVLVHIDTAMGRLGFSEKDFAKTNFENFNISFLLSQLSSSDIKNSHNNQLQKDKLLRAHKKLPQAKLSLANSGGIFLGEEYHFDQIRPGALLYGVNSTYNNQLKLEAVVKIFARVLQIRELDYDQPIGYCGTYLGKKGQKLATIECGYADGILRSLSNAGFCYYDGVKLPYVGRVSMDYIVIDVSALTSAQLNLFKKVEIIGDNVNINQLASLGGTSGYEILTATKCSRFKKVYI